MSWNQPFTTWPGTVFDWHTIGVAIPGQAEQTFGQIANWTRNSYIIIGPAIVINWGLSIPVEGSGFQPTWAGNATTVV